jgi:capsid assembly protease
MHDLTRVLEGQPWAIRPMVLEHMVRVVRAGMPAHMAATPSAAAKSGNVAVIPVTGPITQRGGGIFSLLFGGTSSENLAGTVMQYAADSSVGAIVLEIDSPGGEVYGTDEAATAIREARAAKPIVAVASSLMASAAYWIGAQATEVFVTPSGEIGSVGVYAAHVDESKALDQAGFKVSLIASAPEKVEGASTEPLTDEARATIQAQVDGYARDFERAVAKGRGVSVEKVRSDFGAGRMFRAGAAVERGMADREGTLADAIRRAAYLARTKGAGPVAEVERERIRLELMRA